MNNKPNVLILIATFNGASHVTEQIESILNQEGINIKIIVSDDISSDNTVELIKKTTSQLAFFLRSTKPSGSAGQNFFRILREADLFNYDYIALSDQDDIWLPKKIITAIHKIRTLHLDCYSSNVNGFWPNGRSELVNKSQPQTKWDHMFEAAGPGCTYVMTKSFALTLQEALRNNIQKTTRINLHDWAIYSWARSNGYHWYIDPAPSMLYRQHSNNVIGVNRGARAALARLKKTFSGDYRSQILLTAELCGNGEETPIKRLTRLNFIDRLCLACNARHMRRRLRDKFALAILFFIIR